METKSHTRVAQANEEDYIDRMFALADEAGIQLTFDHQMAFTAIFVERRNVLLTGGAGVGKTTFVKSIVIPMLNHIGRSMGITATTGIAGSHLEGATMHSYLGIGLGPSEAFDMLRKSAVDATYEERQKIFEDTFAKWAHDPKMQSQRRGIMSKLSSLDVLLVDEVSMCPGSGLLDYVDFFLRKIRGEEQLPFGGVQILFVGDFAQLPPVDKLNGTRTDWAFLSHSWRLADVKVCNLTQVFRQEDKEFAGFLNRRRIGIPMTPEEVEYTQRFVRQQTDEEFMKASFLVSTNEEADRLNTQALSRYPGPTYDFPAIMHIPTEGLAHWDTPDKVRKKLLQSCGVNKALLQVRIGTPVLFTVNNPNENYVNGTKGVVKEIVDSPESASGSGIKFWDTTRIVVEITERDGSTRCVTVQRRAFSRSSYESVEILRYDGLPKYPAMRQFPIIPATAITIHKSQGMSLDDCTVDLRKSFAPGHVYVALSRLRTAEGLTLVTSDFRVQVDPDVVEFYRRIK